MLQIDTLVVAWSPDRATPATEGLQDPEGRRFIA